MFLLIIILHDKKQGKELIIETKAVRYLEGL